MSADRHEKWVAVEPGHVIPAGQWYRVEGAPEGPLVFEEVSRFDRHVTADFSVQWFVDSSWRPPLKLPNEPTWGIVLTEGTPRLARWYRTLDGTGLSTGSDCIGIESVLDFIECTPEQVARLEQQS